MYLLTCITISCNKQKLTVNTTIKEGVSIKDGRYVFANRNVFESYVNELGKMSDEELDKLEQSLNFKSRRFIQNHLEEINLNTANTQPVKVQSLGIKLNQVPVDGYELAELIDDSGFASVLNEVYIVQVEDEIFKVNIVDGYVYVLDETNQQYLPQLEDAYLEPNVIYRYEMGLPVLDILDAGGNGVDPCSVDPAFCPSTAISYGPEDAVCEKGQSFENGVCNGCAGTNHRKMQDDTHKTKIKDGYSNGVWTYSVVKFESKISYQPLGIWFSMVSKLKSILIGTTSDPNYNPNTGSGGFTSTPNRKFDFDIMNRSEFNFRKRCKDRQTGFNDDGNGFSLKDEKTYRFYNGTRCLKDYCVISNFGYFNKEESGDPNYNGIKWVLNLKSY